MALYRHVASGTVPGEQWSFTFWTNGNVSLTGAQSTWVTASASLFSTAVRARIHTSVVMTEVATAEVDVATGHQSQRVAQSVTLAGTSTSEPLPFQCATAVSFRTAFATRRGRGRFFLPPLSVSVMSGGRLLTAAVTDLLNGAVNMVNDFQAASLTPVVYSRASRAALTITTIDVGNVIDTQRKRRNKLVEQRQSAVA